VLGQRDDFAIVMLWFEPAEEGDEEDWDSERGWRKNATATEDQSRKHGRTCQRRIKAASE
jgi:hypothetical protein